MKLMKCNDRITKLFSMARPVFLLMIFSIAAVSVQAQLKAPATSSNSVTLSWTAPGDDDNSGTAAQYDIRYSTSNITDINWDAAFQVSDELPPQTAGSDESFTVTDLNPNTTYYFALKTADEVPNWSVLSNIASATTDPEQDAPSLVADLQVTDFTSTTVTMGWTAPGDDSTVGTAAQYDIRYSTSNITDINWDAATQVSGEPSPQSAGRQ